MRRILIAGTIAFLVAVMAGTMLGNDTLLQAFTSSDSTSQVVRTIIIGLLVSLLVTVPPRSSYFRTVLWGASAALSAGVALLLADNMMGALDAAIYVVVAIIFALEALESPVASKAARKKISVVYIPRREKIKI